METPRIPRRTIAALTAEAFGTTLPVLCGQSRNRNVCQYRFAVWHLVRELRPNTSLAELGNLLEKDHTTAIHGLRRAKELVSTDAEFAAGIERARKAIARWRPDAPSEPKLVFRRTLPALVAETPPVANVAASRPGPKLSRDAPQTEYENWFRQSCQCSEARFFDAVRAAHPEKFAQREAAE